MSFVLESGCKGIVFFDTMQDFGKEKCNIYLVFNICLHIKQPFVGAHIVFITRERVGGRDERQLKKGRTQMEQIQQILVGYGKGLGCFWDILGCYAGLARRLRRCSHGSKTNTDSTDVTDLSFHGSFF